METNETATFTVTDRDYAGHTVRTYLHVGAGCDLDQPGTYAAVVNSAAIEDFEIVEVERFDSVTVLVTAERY